MTSIETGSTIVAGSVNSNDPVADSNTLQTAVSAPGGFGGYAVISSSFSSPSPTPGGSDGDHPPPPPPNPNTKWIIIGVVVPASLSI